MLIDASAEMRNFRRPGIQHKYKPTLLVFSSSDCLKVCEWCFRGRLFNGDSYENDVIADKEDVISYTRDHKEIRSILFTGGDSFLADKDYLKEMVRELSGMDHIQSFRFGTRALIHDPDCFEKMLPVLEEASGNKTVYIVLHILKAEEITPGLSKIVRANRKKNDFLSQTPLLKGVNDSPEALTSLFHKMGRVGIQPYYVFQCRPIKGNEKYMLTLGEGQNIVKETRRRLSGVNKRFNYVMSTDEGKLMIAGKDETGDNIFLKYHQPVDETKQDVIITVPAETTWMMDGDPVFQENDEDDRAFALRLNG